MNPIFIAVIMWVSIAYTHYKMGIPASLLSAGISLAAVMIVALLVEGAHLQAIGLAIGTESAVSFRDGWIRKSQEVEA